jgi:hypothetical protein
MQKDLKERISSITRSTFRMVEAAREWENKPADTHWYIFLRKESSILLRRAFKLWLQLRLKRQ